MAWQLSGTYFAPCSCKVGCPCLLGETEADNGWCSAVLVLDITNGNVDGEDVSGERVALVADWPGGFLLGEGRGRVYFDPSTSAAKRAALEAVVSGRKGGTFEAIAGLVPTIEASQEAPITIEVSNEETRLRVGDFVDLRATPLRGPTGEQTVVQHGAAAFREETKLGKLQGSSRPAGFRSWESSAGHFEEAEMDWSG
jgi:hypothetical protein